MFPSFKTLGFKDNKIYTFVLNYETLYLLSSQTLTSITFTLAQVPCYAQVPHHNNLGSLVVEECLRVGGSRRGWGGGLLEARWRRTEGCWEAYAGGVLEARTGVVSSVNGS